MADSTAETSALTRDVKEVDFACVRVAREGLEVPHPLKPATKIHVNVFNTLCFLAQQRATLEDNGVACVVVYVRGNADVEDVHKKVTVGTISGHADGSTLYVATSPGPSTPLTTVPVRDLARIVTSHRVFASADELGTFLKNREDRAGMYEPHTCKPEDDEIQLAAATSADYVRRLKWVMFAPDINHILVVPGNVAKVVGDLLGGDCVHKDLSLRERLVVWKKDTLVMGNIEYGAQLKKSGLNEKLCIRYELM